MGMKYSFDARFELARRVSATFQRSASNFSMPVRWSAINLYLSILHARVSFCMTRHNRRLSLTVCRPHG